MWKVSGKRPEDESEAGDYYDAYAHIYEKNAMRTIQRRIISRALELAHFRPGCKVLDVGCGTGFGMELLTEMGYKVEGVDVSREMVAIAKKKGFKARVADMRKLPFKAKGFDAIISISALQWLKTTAEVEKAALEFARVLKPKGKAVIQFYPNTEAVMLETGRQFRIAGFKGRVQIDSEDNPRKRKIYFALEKI